MSSNRAEGSSETPQDRRVKSKFLMDNSTHSDSLRLFKRQYFQLLELERLSWPERSVLRDSASQEWLHANLFSHVINDRLPPERYRIRVLKHLLSKIEDAIENPEEDDISDNLTLQLTSILSSKRPAEAMLAQQKSYVTYSFVEEFESSVPKEECSITLFESPHIISSSGTTGLRTWEAAVFLGKYLMSSEGRSLIKGKTVLELGAGTGLASMLCARHLGAERVVATDGDEGVVDAIKSNIFLNNLESSQKIEAAVLRWGHFIRQEEFEEDFAIKGLDVVIGADITYERIAIPSLVATLRNLTRLYPAVVVLIAATVRNEMTYSAFQTTCVKNRLRVETIPYAMETESDQRGPFYPTRTEIQLLRILALDEK